MVARDDDREIQSQFCEMKFELYWLAQMALTRQLNIPGFLGSFVTQRPFLFFSFIAANESVENEVEIGLCSKAVANF